MSKDIERRLWDLRTQLTGLIYEADRASGDPARSRQMILEGLLRDLKTVLRTTAAVKR